MSRHHRVRAALVIASIVALGGCASASPSIRGEASAAPGATIARSLPSALSPTASAVALALSPTVVPSPMVVPGNLPVEPALKQLWQGGGKNKGEAGACCVTLAPDGKIWSTAMFDAAFWIMDSSGKFLESWGQPGKGDGEFNFVVDGNGFGAIAFDPDGSFYVADTGNRRIQHFDKDRHFLGKWGSFGTSDGKFVTPAVIASDGRGHVYVSDNDRYDVQEFTADGSYVRTLAMQTTVYFIAVDPDGQLYVDAGPRVRIYRSDGTELSGIDLSNVGVDASGMTFDASGTMYLATVTGYEWPFETKPIYAFDAQHVVQHVWPGQADSIAVSPDGKALYTSLFADAFIRKLAIPEE